MPIWLPFFDQLIQGVLGQSFSNIGATQDAILHWIVGAVGDWLPPLPPLPP
ncbi:MAG: hypothetical protein ACXV3D_03940 [Halobacteriota archaeon]